MLMPSMRHILHCRKTSSLFRRDVQSSQISHPRRSRLVVMSGKMSYLLWFSTMTYDQNLWGDPIDVLTDVKRVLMA